MTAARGGTRPARADLLTALSQGTFRGLTKEYTFAADRVVKDYSFHLHRVEGGRIRYAGPAALPSAG